MYLMGGLNRYSVDTRSSIGRYIGGVSADVSTDTPVFDDILGSSLMIHGYFTSTSPSVLVGIGRYIG